MLDQAEAAEEESQRSETQLLSKVEASLEVDAWSQRIKKMKGKKECREKRKIPSSFVCELES